MLMLQARSKPIPVFPGAAQCLGSFGCPVPTSHTGAGSSSRSPQKYKAALSGFLGFWVPDIQNCEHHLLPLKTSLQWVIKKRGSDTARLNPCALWKQILMAVYLPPLVKGLQ